MAPLPKAKSEPLPLKPFCSFCDKGSASLLRCSRCKVVFYCSKAHQAADRPEHKHTCNAIARETERTEKEAAWLSEAHDGWTSCNPFEISVGSFWSDSDNRDYMRYRYALVEALDKIGPSTWTAVQAAHDHVVDMLRLNHRDNMGLRAVLPSLMLRLGKDQECYDFMKWWGTTGREKTYVWGHEAERHLNIHGADAFEPCNYLTSKPCDLSHVVNMILIKIRLVCDLHKLGAAARALRGKLPHEIIDQIRSYIPLTLIVATKSDMVTADPEVLHTLVKELMGQIKNLAEASIENNPYIWTYILEGNEENLMANTSSFSSGSPEQALRIFRFTYKAWMETPGALRYLRYLHHLELLHALAL